MNVISTATSDLSQFSRDLGSHYIILRVLSTLLFYQCENVYYQGEQRYAEGQICLVQSNEHQNRREKKN